MALRSTSPEDFEEQFAQLRGHLGTGDSGIRAVAGEHTVPELWMLGSTDGGARIAAQLGLRLRQGRPQPIPTVEDAEAIVGQLSPAERAAVTRRSSA